MGVGRAKASAWGDVRSFLSAGIAPGLTACRRRPVGRTGAALLVLGTVAPVVWLVVSVLRHRSWVALGLDRAFLGQLVIVLAVVALCRVVAIAGLLASKRKAPGFGGRATIGVVVLAAVMVPCVVGADTAVEARANIELAFEVGSEDPLFYAGDTLPDTVAPTIPSPTTSLPVGVSAAPTTTDREARQPPVDVVSLPRRPDSGVDPELLADVETILLLGGDAGPGRGGLRTDSMILVSIHEPSGRAALISVPRNLERLLFPPGSALADKYPQGFTEIANAVYPIVASNEALRDAYEVDGLRPGAVAIAQGIGYSLDVTIDDYVLIDMKGFVDVVDTLGGVNVHVPKAVPTPGNPPDAKHEVPPMIEAGDQYMDGTTALAYVRSRHSDTDYHRAGRQRAVLAALARQVSLGDAFAGYSAVVRALGESLRTSLTTDEFTELLALIGGETAIVESMGLVPPLVDPTQPDYDALAKIVGEIQLAIVNGTESGY